MTDNIKLLPCPFCGSTDIFTEPDERGSGGQWCSPIHVGCRSCKAEQRGDDVVFARANWNRRAAVEADRARRGEPVGYFQDTGHYRYEQVGDDFKDDSDVFPLYRAPHPADTNLDYKELYEQMCDRCDYLDAELAKHAEKSGQPTASAGPMEGQQPYPEIPTPDIISDGEHEDSYSRHVVETAMQSAHDRGYSVGWDHGLEHGRKESISPVAQEPVAEVLSSRKGNDTSTIDKALPDGTKLYTAPVAAQPSVPTNEQKMLRRWLDYGRSQHMARHLVADTQDMLKGIEQP